MSVIAAYWVRYVIIRNRLTLPKMKNTVLELRRERELSQEDLARAAGVSRQTIISIEKGRYAPSLALAFTLANIFDTSIESLFLPGD